MPDPFISPQDVVDYIGRGTAIDQVFIIATDAACDMCRDIAGQSFNAGTSTVTLDGSGTDVVLLPERPVNGVSNVVVNGSTITDYAVNPNGILFRGSVGAGQCGTWPEGRQNVTVTYSHGYQEIDMPRSVRMVALSVASRLAVQGGIKQESVGAVSVTYAANSTDLTNGERMILEKHRQIR